MNILSLFHLQKWIRNKNLGNLTDSYRNHGAIKNGGSINLFWQVDGESVYSIFTGQSKKLFHPSISTSSAVADPGERPGGGGRPPLFVDQTEARRAEKNFFSETTPLSQGLDPALLCKRLVYWVVYSSFCHSERGICTRHKGLRENNTMFYL